jgi:transcription elongation GreA/GreB family factor
LKQPNHSGLEEYMREKDILYAYCTNYVRQRLARTQEEISKIQSSANEETKSSAGDKYETGRAMAQLEVERNTAQLREAEKLQGILLNLRTIGNTDVVIPGSLVKTSKGIFYIAISLGLITLEQKQYFIISTDSPIGKLLMGKKIGDFATWNKQIYSIQAIE